MVMIQIPPPYHNKNVNTITDVVVVVVTWNGCSNRRIARYKTGCITFGDSGSEPNDAM